MNGKLTKAPESIIEFGKSVIQLELNALQKLSGLINAHFVKAVEAILSIPPSGRLVVSGIGKTGFIGSKISATFASLGVPSFFLHPSEAVHGDMGRVAPDDLVLLLSNSGETTEVIRLLPGLRLARCKILTLTSNPNSVLAKKSDLILPICETDEACPLGLAPTTSTTTMLAMGDALAMTISALRPITKEQFAVYHPGGNLGRTLLLVSDVMRTGEALCVANLKVTAREVIHKITETKGRPGAAAIVDDSGYLCGVFTDGNLRRLLYQKVDFLDEPVSKHMGSSPKTTTPSVQAQEALKILSEFKIDQVIVVDPENRPVGMLDIQDLVGWNEN